MRRDHRLSRRLFLSEFGRRTFAVAVLGSTVAACSTDDGASSATTTGDSDNTADTTASTAAGDEAARDEAATEEEGAGAAEGDELRWERADFGFVSAYVLARGNEVAIVDTGVRGSSSTIEDALSALSFGWADVDHVIVTHAHGDHVGGLDAVLTLAPDSVGYAGSGDIDNLAVPRDIVSLDGGEEIFGLQIVNTPGHTPGHITAFDPGTGLLLAGDAMIVSDGSLTGPASEFSDDVDLANDSVKALAGDALGGNEVNTILVGHGDPVTDNAGSQLTALAAEL